MRAGYLDFQASLKTAMFHSEVTPHKGAGLSFNLHLAPYEQKWVGWDMVLKSFESRAFFTLVLLVTVVFFWMTRGFLMPVFWAIVLAVLFQPLNAKAIRILKGRRAWAALLATLAVILVVLIPLALIVATVTQQALGLYEQYQSGQIDVMAPFSMIEKYLPELTSLLQRFGVDLEQVRTNLESIAVTATQWVGAQALAIGQNLAAISVMFVLMLYFLFFIFRDGEELIGHTIRALPIGDEREKKLFKKIAEVARATVKGTLVVAMVQGFIGGILFWIVGIQAPAFWAVIMGVLSLIPAAGAAIVWFPAAVYFLATGSIWKGVFLVASGSIIIGLVDNILRPILVGRETKMPDYVVLLATLGGLQVFGLAGFVVGPMITALFLAMWQIFTEEFAKHDSSAKP